MLFWMRIDWFFSVLALICRRESSFFFLVENLLRPIICFPRFALKFSLFQGRLKSGKSSFHVKDLQSIRLQFSRHAKFRPWQRLRLFYRDRVRRQLVYRYFLRYRQVWFWAFFCLSCTCRRRLPVIFRLFASWVGKSDYLRYLPEGPNMHTCWHNRQEQSWWQ